MTLQECCELIKAHGGSRNVIISGTKGPTRYAKKVYRDEDLVTNVICVDIPVDAGIDPAPAGEAVPALIEAGCKFNG